MRAPALATPGAGLALFALGYALVFALLHPGLDQPPVWDTTMGLFPSAIVLSENGFDLADLLARPGWAQGGPSIHPFSLPTWLTALALHVIPDDAVLLRSLHAVHFAIAALALLGAFRLGALVLGPGLALALSGTLLLFPLFQVQAGYLYSEMPLAAASVWAVVWAARRRWLAAVALSSLACFIKEVGIIVPVALALAAALDRGSPSGRAGRVAAFAVAPLILAALQIFVALPVEAASGFVPPPYRVYAIDAVGKLARVPDLAVLVAVAAAIGVLRGGETWRALRGRAALTGDAGPRGIALSLLLFAAFAAFYALLPFTGVEVYVLPRYYVQVAALLLLVVTAEAQRLGGVRVAGGVLAALALLFVVNRGGVLYPPVPGNEFSLAERSFEYRDLLATQRQLLEAAIALPGGTPVFYGLPEHFLFHYPRMGYAEGPLPEGHCVWLEPRYLRGRLQDYPSRFAILYDFVGYGGNAFQALLRQARADPTRRVRAQVFSQGRYRTVLFQVGPAPRARPGSDSRKVPPEPADT